MKDRQSIQVSVTKLTFWTVQNITKIHGKSFMLFDCTMV